MIQQGSLLNKMVDMRCEREIRQMVVNRWLATLHGVRATITHHHRRHQLGFRRCGGAARHGQGAGGELPREHQYKRQNPPKPAGIPRETELARSHRAGS
jgi:hypothetical protein